MISIAIPDPGLHSTLLVFTHTYTHYALACSHTLSHTHTPNVDVDVLTISPADRKCQSAAGNDLHRAGNPNAVQARKKRKKKKNGVSSNKEDEKNSQ